MSRYQRAADIGDLIVSLVESKRGLTLKEISNRYGVSRRTAERMRDAVAARFPLLESDREEGDRQKRWRIDGRAQRGLVTFEPGDRELLEQAAQALADAGRAELAEDLSRIARRIRRIR